MDAPRTHTLSARRYDPYGPPGSLAAPISIHLGSNLGQTVGFLGLPDFRDRKYAKKLKSLRSQVKAWPNGPREPVGPIHKSPWRFGDTIAHPVGLAYIQLGGACCDLWRGVFNNWSFCVVAVGKCCCHCYLLDFRMFFVRFGDHFFVAVCHLLSVEGGKQQTTNDTQHLERSGHGGGDGPQGNWIYIYIYIYICIFFLVLHMRA